LRSSRQTGLFQTSRPKSAVEKEAKASTVNRSIYLEDIFSREQKNLRNARLGSRQVVGSGLVGGGWGFCTSQFRWQSQGQIRNRWSRKQRSFGHRIKLASHGRWVQGFKQQQSKRPPKPGSVLLLCLTQVVLSKQQRRLKQRWRLSGRYQPKRQRSQDRSAHSRRHHYQNRQQPCQRSSRDSVSTWIKNLLLHVQSLPGSSPEQVYNSQLRRRKLRVLAPGVY